MKRHLLGILVCLALGLAAAARADVFTPAGSCGFGMPGQGGTRQMRAACQGNEIHLQYTVMHQFCEYAKKQVSVTVDGKTVTKEVVECITKQVPQSCERIAALDQVKAFGMDRKKVSPRQLKSLLAESRTVLVCEHDQKVDAAYLKLARPGTLVLMLPPVQPMHGIAVPAQPPEPAPGQSGDTPPPPPASAAPAPIQAAPPAPPAPVEGNVELAPQETLVVPVRGEPAKSFSEPLAALAGISGDLVNIRRSITTTQTTVTTVCVEDAEGRCIPETAALNYTTRTEQSVAVSPRTAKAFTVSGEALTGEELTRRLAAETPVLVSSDGREVNPSFLEIIRDDALILVVPVPALPLPAPAPVGESGPPRT